MTPFPGGILGQQGSDLRHRIVYTMLLLLLFRLLAHVPVINVNEAQLNHLLANNPLIGVVDLFAGGEVLTRFSVVAAGIFPYLLALVLAKGATWVVPSLRELRRRGEQGEKRLEFFAKLLTIPLAFIFAWAISQYLAQQTGLFPGQIHWFTAASFLPSLRVVSLVTAGSLVSTGIADVITRKGIGPGHNVVLLAGSSFAFAKQIMQIVRESPHSKIAIQRLVLVAVFGLVVVVLSIFLVESVRKVPIQWPKRTPSLRSGRLPVPSSYVPFLLNSGGILPVSGAMGLLTLLQFAQVFLQSHFRGTLGAVGRALSAWATPSNGLYWITFASLIVLFTYICNFSVIWKPFSNEDLSLAEHFRHNWYYVPGLRPGAQTEEYLSRMMARITLPGALGLAFLAAGVPYAVLRLTQQNVIVTILSLMVVVKTVEGLRDQIRVYNIKYEGFAPRSGRIRAR